jgi:hypothetical protein
MFWGGEASNLFFLNMSGWLSFHEEKFIHYVDAVSSIGPLISDYDNSALLTLLHNLELVP